MCNGCYGCLLSIYTVKAGTGEEEERAQVLADALLSLLSKDDRRRAELLFQTAERRAERLSPEGLRFIASAEHIASQLQADPQLEWSGAIIGLCKAVEVEVAHRIFRPLATRLSQSDLSRDLDDKDLARIAAFCADPRRKPPELGTFAHFLQTAIHSQKRRQTSVLLGIFLRLLADYVGSDWLLNPNGFYKALVTLLSEFRNRAAHIDELGKEEYAACRELVIGREGALWQLTLATQPHKR